MSPLRPAIALLAFVVAAGGAAVVGVRTSPRTTPVTVAFGQHLSSYPWLKARIVRLPDGGSIAIGSRSGHDVSVQWQDRSSRTWTKPRIVEFERKLWTHDISVHRLGPTVSIAPDWWVQKVMDDDYAPSFTGIVVCRDYRCAPARKSPRLSSAAIAEKGDFVTFGLDDNTLLLWEAGQGYRRSPITGMPRKSGSYNIRLLSDGKFVGVVGRWDGKKCHYDLYTTSRRSTHFRLAARTPGFYDAKPCFLSGTDVSGNDRVTVWVEMLSDAIIFRRHDDSWSLDPQALSRMQIKDTRGRSTLAPVETSVGRRSVVFGSHDMRRILFQERTGRRDAWSKPKVIAHAPKGTLCRNGTTNSTQQIRRPAVMVLIQCYAGTERPSREDAPADVALVFATSDGRHWLMGRVRGPSWEPLTSKTKVIAIGSDRSLAYTRGAKSFTTIRLPLTGRWNAYGLLPDGEHAVRVTGNGNPAARCAPGYSFAALTDETWPPSTPIADPDFPRGGTCTASVYAEEPNIFEVGVYQPDLQWENGMRLKGGRLTVIPME